MSICNLYLSVTAVMYVTTCHIGPHYNGTHMYITILKLKCGSVTTYTYPAIVETLLPVDIIKGECAQPARYNQNMSCKDTTISVMFSWLSMTSFSMSGDIPHNLGITSRLTVHYLSICPAQQCKYSLKCRSLGWNGDILEKWSVVSNGIKVRYRFLHGKECKADLQ